MTNNNNNLQSNFDKAIDNSLVPPQVSVVLNAEGLLPISELSRPVRTTFPAWRAVRPGIRYQLLWDDQPVGEIKIIEPGTVPGDTLVLHIPVAALSEGKHRLSYRLTNPENGVISDAQSSPIEVDLTAPGSPVLAPILFPEVVKDGLTSEELERLDNILPGIIAGYQGMREGDLIRTYWNRLPGPTAVVTKDDMGLRRVMVDFKRSFLETIGDIEAPVYYSVTDLAGNLSMDSRRVNVKLQLSPLVPIPRPRIKEANGDTLDPINTPNGATVIIEASARLRAGDRVYTIWNGPKGSGYKDQIVTESEAGKALEVVFAPSLVNDNAGQIVKVVYAVYRLNGPMQRSEEIRIKVLERFGDLPAPRIKEATGDSLDPINTPNGATVVIDASARLRAGDRVYTIWNGPKGSGNRDQIVTESEAGKALEVVFASSLVTNNIGEVVKVAYAVYRLDGPMQRSEEVSVRIVEGFRFDTSPVTLAGKVYLLPGTPDLLPQLPPGTSVQRTAAGGQAPYSYTSSDQRVAKVDSDGLTTVRGNGKALITATDASGAALSFEVTVTGVIHCIGVGQGKYAAMSAAAAGIGGRLPDVNELKALYAAYGGRWPMGNGNYWSSTVAAQNLVGMKWYYVKNLVTGLDFKLMEHSASLCVALR